MQLRAHGIVAFAAGVAMAVEMLTPRVLAPHVGTTVPVWTAAIGAALAGLAAGAALGGRLADRFAPRAVKSAAFALAAPAVALVPTIAAATADFGGSLSLRAWLAAGASCFLPSLLLGGVAPAVARDEVRRGEGASRALGGLAAAGALGGLVGVLLVSEVLVSFVRTSVSFPLLGAGCAVVAVLARLGPGRAPSLRAARRAPVPPAPTLQALRLAPAAVLSAVVGAATLAVEVLAARSTAVRAGAGTPTWTAVIGVALVGLAAGGAVGGRLAARVAVARLLPLLLLAAAVATALALALEEAGGGLLALSRLPFRARVAEAVTLRFLPAFLALGAIPPVLAAAVLASPERDGRRIGAVSAAGTVGALVGAVVTAPVLVPALGLEHAFAAVAGALVLSAVAVGSLRACGRVTLAAAVAAAALVAVASPALRPRERAWVRDSAYARILVEEAPADRAFGRDVRRMWIDDRVQGYEDVGDPAWPGSPYVGVVLAVSERATEGAAAPRVLCLGGGSYTFPRALLSARPDARVDVVEIDPAVTRTARERLGLAQDPGFTIVHEDARTYVRRLPEAPLYDLVFVDAFADVSIPWHLATREFFVALRRRAAPDAVLVLNLIDVVDEGRLLFALRATAASVFRRTAALGVDADRIRERNVLLVASDRDLPLDGLVRVNPAPKGRPLPVFRHRASELDEGARRVGAYPLTDDFAPVDDLVEPLYVHR